MELSSFMSYLLSGIVIGLVYALVAVGFSLIFGVAKVMFFAHGEMYMLGAVAAYFFLEKMGLPFLFVIIIVMVVIGVLGVLINRFLRPLQGKDLSMVLATVALSMVIANGAMHLFGHIPLAVSTQVSGSINILGAKLTLERLVIILAAAAVVLGLHFFIQRTKEGRAIRALAQDRDAAQLQGVDVNRSASIVFLFGCAAAGMAGVLIAPIYFVDVFMGTPALMNTIIVVIIGGLGSFPGAILGGLFLGIVESFGFALAGGLSHLISFAIVIILLIIRPQGLLGRE